MYYEISKADWKLYRTMLAVWQEAYMERLTQEYIEILSGEGRGSQKWWALEKRMKEDRKCPGVIVEVKKSNVPWVLLDLLRCQAITPEDLNGFSDDLTERVLWVYRGDQKDDMEEDPEEDANEDE